MRRLRVRLSPSAPFLGTFGQIRKSFCLLAFVEISICWAISDNASPRGKTLQNDGMKGIFCGVSRGIWGETKLLFWGLNLSVSKTSPAFRLSSTATDSSPDTLRRLTLCESRPPSRGLWMRCLTRFYDRCGYQIVNDTISLTRFAQLQIAFSLFTIIMTIVIIVIGGECDVQSQV